MRRRSVPAIVAFLVVLSVGVGAQPASAAGTLEVGATSVAAGADLKLHIAGCSFDEEQTWVQQPHVLLVSGTAPNEVLAQYPTSSDEGGGKYVIHVPRWVDPALPAALVGECLRTELVSPDPADWVTTVQFTFPDVPIDIMAKHGTDPGPAVVPERTTAAGGQVIVEAASGCKANDWATVHVYEGDNLSGRGQPDLVRYDEARTGPDGSAKIDLTLLQQDISANSKGPLAEGTYTVRGACGLEEMHDVKWAKQHLITVTGTNPSTEFDLRVDAGRIVASGSGCTGGRMVQVTLTENPHRPGLTPSIDATPDTNGAWSGDVQVPSGRSYAVGSTADCGDPSMDGFRYVPKYVSGGHDEPPPVEDTVPGAPSTTTTAPTSTSAATAAQPVAGAPTFTG